MQTVGIADCWRPAKAAELAGVTRSAIYQAIRRGQINTVETACGLTLLHRAELDRWISEADDRQGRGGRPRKEETSG